MFVLQLRTSQSEQALALIGEKFSSCLYVTKADPNEKRRRTVLKELKSVLDLVERTKQERNDTQPAVSKSNRNSLVPEEIGQELTPEMDPSSESCCVS
ncbi:hypothetical protein P879_06543 [Paragonimus westermani]|uniref:Uncharacterized protein n=1 Tax=Paragonimus westermani TaxID=34504 RepID=A0A8T0DKX5_9TREM|nr:hypothetical protein P879_06543 [Paragonimus westermani]